MSKKDKPQGTFQAPPPGAPHQVSQPLSSTDRSAMLAKAQQHERELKPLTATGPGLGANSAPIVHPAASTTSGSVAEAPPPVAEGQGGQAAGAEEGETLAAVAEVFNGPAGTQTASTPPDPRFVIPDHGAGRVRPAESDTDSPSRGIPTPTLDPGKQVTGGWGDSGGEYFALDGAELAQVTQTLFRDLQRQMSADLRFGISTVYPQVRVRVQVLVDGIDPSVPVSEQKFDLGATRILELEGLVQDDQDSPADALRDQAGLTKPRKQRLNGVSFDVPVTAGA